MNSKMFPIQKSNPIPWEEAERAYRTYARLYGGNQSLERLAERGGFGVQEFSCYWYGHEPNRDCTHGYPLDRVAKLETRIAELEAQMKAERFTSEQLQRTIDSMAATEAKHAAEMSKCLRGMDEANEKLRERLTARNAQLKAAREALEIARQETRIAAVMLDQVEPSAAITVKESDRLHLAANKMRTVSDLSDKALAALDGEVKA